MAIGPYSRRFIREVLPVKEEINRLSIANVNTIDRTSGG
jgi:hypothetical protein